MAADAALQDAVVVTRGPGARQRESTSCRSAHGAMPRSLANRTMARSWQLAPCLRRVPSAIDSSQAPAAHASHGSCAHSFGDMYICEKQRRTAASAAPGMRQAVSSAEVHGALARRIVRAQHAVAFATAFASHPGSELHSPQSAAQHASPERLPARQ